MIHIYIKTTNGGEFSTQKVKHQPRLGDVFFPGIKFTDCDGDTYYIPYTAIITILEQNEVF